MAVDMHIPVQCWPIFRELTSGHEKAPKFGAIVLFSPEKSGEAAGLAAVGHINLCQAQLKA